MLPGFVVEFVEAWDEGVYRSYPFPRSLWLRDFERDLSSEFPFASSADRKLTARHYAPFPLALGPNVP